MKIARNLAWQITIVCFFCFFRCNNSRMYICHIFSTSSVVNPGVTASLCVSPSVGCFLTTQTATCEKHGRKIVPILCSWDSWVLQAGSTLFAGVTIERRMSLFKHSFPMAALPRCKSSRTAPIFSGGDKERYDWVCSPPQLMSRHWEVTLQFSVASLLWTLPSVLSCKRLDTFEVFGGWLCLIFVMLILSAGSK